MVRMYGIRNMDIYIALQKLAIFYWSVQNILLPLAILLSFMYMAEWFRFFIINKTS
jgi:hypothetical protein